MAVSRSTLQESATQADPRLATRDVTSDLIAYVIEKIVRAISPCKIILFGSRSRGQATKSSDLDLLIVHDTGRPNRQVRREIEHLLWGRRFPLDLIVTTPEQIKRSVADGNPFYTRHIRTDGKVLYDQACPPVHRGVLRPYFHPFVLCLQGRAFSPSNGQGCAVPQCLV